MAIYEAFLRNRAWRQILRAPEQRSAGLLVRASMTPIEADALLRAELYMAGRGFKAVIAAPRQRRIAAIAHDATGAPVAHALIVTHVPGNRFGDDIRLRLGFVLGAIGIFVAPARRGEGLAQRCLEAAGAFLMGALSPALAQDAVLASEAHVLGLCRQALPFPVVARWREDRENAATEAEHFHLARAKLQTTARGRAASAAVRAA